MRRRRAAPARPQYAATGGCRMTEMKPETLTVHAGTAPDPTTKARSEEHTSELQSPPPPPPPPPPPHTHPLLTLSYPSLLPPISLSFSLLFFLFSFVFLILFS